MDKDSYGIYGRQSSFSGLLKTALIEKITHASKTIKQYPRDPVCMTYFKYAFKCFNISHINFHQTFNK